MKHIGNIALVLFFVGYGTFYYLNVLSQASRIEHHATITFIFVALAILALISLIIDVRALVKDRKAVGFAWVDEKKPFVFLVAMVLYLILIPYLGFFVSSFGFFVSIAVWMGSRKWKEYFLVPVVMLGVVYVLFVVLLGQRIASGLII